MRFRDMAIYGLLHCAPNGRSINSIVALYSVDGFHSFTYCLQHSFAYCSSSRSCV